MLGIILSILVALLKSLWEVTWKYLTHQQQKDSIDEYSLAFSIRCIVTLLIFWVCLWQGLIFPSWSFASIIIISAIINALTTVTALKAVKYGDISLVGPLSSLTIPFLILSSYLILWETSNILWYLWVGIICIGTYLLWIGDIKSWLLSPIKNIFSDPWAKYMLITALLWSLSAPIDKLGLLEIGTFHWLMYTNLLTSLLLWVYTLWVRQTPINSLIYTKNIKKSFLYAWVLWLGMVLQMLALKYTLTLYVISIKRASWIFSVLLGAFIFKEKHIIQKLIAASIMLLWVVIITLFGNI